MGNFFKIRDLKVYNPKVLQDIRLSLLADVHLSHLVSSRKLDSVTEQTLTFNPHYICIAGDLLDYLNILEEKKYMDILKGWLSDISSVPVLICLGSHDMAKKVSKTIDERGWIYSDYQSFFKELENSVPNVYVLDDRNFKDDRIFISGYTQKEKYISATEDSSAISLLEEDLSSQDFLLRQKLDVPALSLIHDPIYLTESEITRLLENYDFIFSGHMHNGCVPPILDEIWRSNLGLIRPNKKLIAPNARGVIPIRVNDKTIYLVVNSGIVKIQETAPRILWPFDSLFPSSIENITITNDSSFKSPKIKSYYKF